MFVSSTLYLNCVNMEKIESLKEYYQITKKKVPEDLLIQSRCPIHFNILRKKEKCCVGGLPFARRDYWKITLFDNRAELITKQGNVIINKPCIFFSQPNMEYGWKLLDEEQTGFICLFNDEYLTYELKPIFELLIRTLNASQTSYLFLEQDTYRLLFFFFEQLYNVYHSDFEHRKEVVKKWLQLIVYQVIWTQSINNPVELKQDAKSRIVNEFVNALESQFPVDSPLNPIWLKSPSDFANLLHVHVNHLNHCLKSRTGKSTTQLINERITAEAIGLLRYSDWNISEIAEALGFEYVQHFTLFLKKNIGISPTEFRLKKINNI